MLGDTVIKFLMLTGSLLYGCTSLVAQSAYSQYKTVDISRIPKPTAPAVLEVTNISFTDFGIAKNNILDAKEQGNISFTITNIGEGEAYGLNVHIQDMNRVTGLDFQTTKALSDIAPGQSLTVTLPVNAAEDVPTAEANFKIEIREGNGFDVDPFFVTFDTEKFKNPQIDLTDFYFSNNVGEGIITIGEVVSLNLLIQNTGQGFGSNIQVSFEMPENVFPVDETIIEISDLASGESRKIRFGFFVNRRFEDTTIPIQVNITERYGRYGTQKVCSVSLEETLSQTRIVDVEGNRTAPTIINPASLVADVDRNIPTGRDWAQENTYVLIFGNEDYAKYAGINPESNVEFARNDARIFKEYCVRTLGIPEANIRLEMDATAGMMNKQIQWINALTKASTGNLEVIFYYAGHGFPDMETREAYLIPVDVSPSNLAGAIKLNELYASLSEHPHSRVTVFLDACFSGGARNQPLLSARAIRIKPKSAQVSGNMVVFAASSQDQLSLPYREMQHGMFTYFLLKKLQETNGAVSYGELRTYLMEKVPFQSVLENDREQVPTVTPSAILQNQWESWSLID